MNRNDVSRVVLGRERGDVVQRAAGRQWLRWWGLGGAFLAVAIFVPISTAKTRLMGGASEVNRCPASAPVRQTEGSRERRISGSS